MKQYFKLALCVLLSVLLLTGCGKQPSEDAVPTTTQPVTEATHGLEEGELPPVAIPQETESVTQPAEETTAPETTQATEDTQPPETTEPTESTDSPGFDDDELPPVPIG